MSIRGRFVWEELMTTDVSASAAFYNKVGGLTTQKAAWDPNYTLFQASGSTMGGTMPLPDEAKAGGTQAMWMSYVGTPDADDTARRITALGGKVHKGPWDIAEGGRIAIVADPQGAIFAIYANPKATGAPPAPKLGHASWHELATSDFAGAFLFYQTLFGWHVVNDMDMGPGMGTYRLFAAEGMTEAFGGMYTKPPQPERPASWLPYIKVANVKAATEAAKKLGATVFHGPAQVPGGGWITMAADPQGAAFAVHSTPGTAASPKPGTKGTKKKTMKAPKKKAVPKPKAKAGAKNKVAPKKKVAKKRKAGPKK
jgi:predicted enzyme related to lactoylglutathione lyase